MCQPRHDSDIHMQIQTSETSPNKSSDSVFDITSVYFVELRVTFLPTDALLGTHGNAKPPDIPFLKILISFSQKQLKPSKNDVERTFFDLPGQTSDWTPQRTSQIMLTLLSDESDAEYDDIFRYQSVLTLVQTERGNLFSLYVKAKITPYSTMPMSAAPPQTKTFTQGSFTRTCVL